MASGDKLAFPALAAGFYSLQGEIEKGTGDTLNLPEGMVNVGGNGYGYLLSAQTNWDPTANDDGTITSLSIGDDVYVYAAQDVSGIAQWIASTNSTFPTGYDATNSRKIGGFHYGKVRPIADRFSSAATLSTQIVPNSCWDLQHRPKCDPTGMVEVGNFWVDIYLASEDGTAWPDTIPQSAYSATPLTGTEGYSYFDYSRLAQNADKRLPTYSESLQFAYGVPEGATGTGGRQNTGDHTGYGFEAVSCLNVDQPAGNVNQICAEYFDLGGTFGWAGHDEGKDSAYAHGSLYNAAARQLLFGGGWGNGSDAGARCAYFYNAPWAVSASVGLRCVSDSL